MVGSNFQHLSCSACTGQREGHCTWLNADSPRPQLWWFVDFVDFIIFGSLFWKPLLLPLPSSQINHMGKGFELKAIQTFNFRHYYKCEILSIFFPNNGLLSSRSWCVVPISIGTLWIEWGNSLKFFFSYHGLNFFCFTFFFHIISLWV